MNSILNLMGGAADDVLAVLSNADKYKYDAVISVFERHYNVI